MSGFKEHAEAAGAISKVKSKYAKEICREINSSQDAYVKPNLMLNQASSKSITLRDDSIIYKDETTTRRSPRKRTISNRKPKKKHPSKMTADEIIS